MFNPYKKHITVGAESDSAPPSSKFNCFMVDKMTIIELF